ncbi:TatD family hydrolase [Candidatus Pelagibacter sp. HIMB1321]|uniref:TatD family hydrolase n=1 Tax=Candidatus Pelagibacter sp. HIMB1321 TaxID=1388755 RepID=UPI000A0805BB|nr:TatD family hydrolase [Candidatus Pelagibacter sp. HIMB1321]SMF75435.1 TatD DNase family protein [Candidatus Pelagibacter sp. HIMB1321]
MIDSHCHLDHSPLFDDIGNVIKRSKEVGIEKLLTICTTIKSFEKIKLLVKQDDIIFGTYGIHPHEAKNDKVNSDIIIKEVKNNNKIIGIGETGLDFYYNYSDKDDQITSFEEHIKASIKLNIPLIVHSRNAEKETLEVFSKFKNKNLKILMHCFTGSKEFVDNLLSFGAYFSASGIITFKNSLELQETFKSIPLNKLLIETDSPYLAPVPNRGKQNEPSYVKFTAQKLAEIKNISNLDLIKNTTSNFNNLFN